MRNMRWLLATGMVVLAMTAGGGRAAAQDVDEFGLPIVPGRTVVIERMGTVNRIEEAGMVVDDAWVGFSARTRFFSRKNQPIQRDALQEGDKVGFAMEADGTTAKAVWKLP